MLDPASEVAAAAGELAGGAAAAARGVLHTTGGFLDLLETDAIGYIENVSGRASLLVGDALALPAPLGDRLRGDMAARPSA
jgi:hypothetical protein